MNRLVYAISLPASFGLCLFLAMAENNGTGQPYSFLLSVSWLIFGFMRLDNSRMSNWWGFCFFLPLVNLVLFLSLLFVPAKRETL